MLGKKLVLEKFAFNKNTIIEMEMFNVHRRDIMSFDNYMDLKKPGFGGPSSAKMYRDKNGKKVNDNPKLDGFQRVVDRHPAFKHEVYNPTYKAMSNDLVYKQEKKKPMNYPDSYDHMGIPVVMVGKAANEGMSHTSFKQFVNEYYDQAESMGVNPDGATKMGLRGKSVGDAIGDAEDKLMQARIDFDSFYRSKDGTRIDYLDADGDMVAFVDIKARKLHIMPDAPVMDDTKYKKIFEPNSSEPTDDTEDWEEDTEGGEDDAYGFNEPRQKEEDEFEEEEEEAPADMTSVKAAERLLRSFETEEDEEEEEY